MVNLNRFNGSCNKELINKLFIFDWKNTSKYNSTTTKSKYSFKYYNALMKTLQLKRSKCMLLKAKDY